MSIKQIEIIVEHLKSKAAGNPALEEFVASFEEFFELYKLREAEPNRPDRQELLNRLREARKRFLLSFAKMGPHHNKSPEEMAEYFENPQNFSVKQWETIQNAKLEGDAYLPSPKKMRRKSARGSIRI